MSPQIFCIERSIVIAFRPYKTPGKRSGCNGHKIILATPLEYDDGYGVRFSIRRTLLGQKKSQKEQEKKEKPKTKLEPPSPSRARERDSALTPPPHFSVRRIEKSVYIRSMIRIGSRRVFTTEIKIVKVVTQRAHRRTEARNSSFAHNYWSGHCRTGRTYCYGPDNSTNTEVQSSKARACACACARS